MSRQACGLSTLCRTEHLGQMPTPSDEPYPDSGALLIDRCERATVLAKVEIAVLALSWIRSPDTASAGQRLDRALERLCLVSSLADHRAQMSTACYASH